MFFVVEKPRLQRMIAVWPPPPPLPPPAAEDVPKRAEPTLFPMDDEE